MYNARVDSDPTLKGAPYQKAFGDSPRLELGAEMDWQVLRIPYLGTLGPGQQKSVRVTGTCASPAAAALNRATATAEGGLSAGGQAALEIVGVAGLSLKRTDKGDPVAVGKRVTYQIEVNNTGSAPAADHRLAAAG